MPQRIGYERQVNVKARPVEEHDPDRAEANRFYASAQWRWLRRLILRRSPLCQCKDECGGLSEEVHHVIDRRVCPERAFDPTNLIAMTKACHSRETRARQIDKGKS